MSAQAGSAWGVSAQVWGCLPRGCLPSNCHCHRQTDARETRMHSSRMRTTCSSSHLLRGCLPQCMLEYTPQVWAWKPPWVWVWRHPPRCGPGDPPRPDPSSSPWVWAWKPARHAGILPLPLETCKACWDTTPSPVNRITDTCKNITLPQLHCRW